MTKLKEGETMNFEHIHYILELAGHSSISSAAKKLHISQPSLTLVIQKVEAELNIKIFERAYSGIRLTDEGKRALPYLRSLHHTYREMRETLHDQEDKLVLGLSSGIVYFVQPIVSKLKKLFLSFQIESVDFQANVLDAVQDGKFDLTVLTADKYKRLIDREKFVFVPFMNSKVIALSNTQIEGTELSIRDFQQKNLIIYKQQDIEQYIQQVPNFTKELAGYISTMNGDLIKQLLEHEDFFHITLDKSIPHFDPDLLKKLHQYSIKELDRTFQYGWIYLKNSPKAKTLENILTKHLFV